MIARGSVRAVRGPLVEIAMPALPVGTGVRIETQPCASFGSIVACMHDGVLAALHGDTRGIAAGVAVREDACASRAVLGCAALGRAIDARGAALDEGPRLRGAVHEVDAPAPAPSLRGRIDSPLWTGIKAIDALLTIGRGARVGIFGPPGAGKSSLVEAIVRGARADAVIVGLIGERGREARLWIDRLERRSTIVCATSDRSPSERVRAAHLALAQARALAERGAHVLVMLDSLARFAAASRELALALGEPAGRGGYPPSVFGALARLLECGGAFARGSVTLLATVLSDGDERDPVSDAARSLLDGHVMLSPELARAGHFPAIDVLASAARTMGAVAGADHMRAAGVVRAALALLARSADARALGFAAQDAATERAVAVQDRLEALLRQGSEIVEPARTLAMLAETADILGEPHGHYD